MTGWIKRILPFYFTARALVIIFSLVMIFHLLALIGIIPADILWGGRMKTTSERIVFESISLCLNAVMLITVCHKANWWNWKLNQKLIQVILWVMVVLFIANTLGNMMAINSLETLIFTPITFVLALLSFRLVI